MNKTENKTQVDFSNIRDLQNIIKTNGISKLAMGVKSFKQRLSLIGTKITDTKKKTEIAKVEVKESVEVVELKSTAKDSVQKIAEEIAAKEALENPENEGQQW